MSDRIDNSSIRQIFNPIVDSAKMSIDNSVAILKSGLKTGMNAALKSTDVGSKDIRHLKDIKNEPGKAAVAGGKILLVTALALTGGLNAVTALRIYNQFKESSIKKDTSKLEANIKKDISQLEAQIKTNNKSLEKFKEIEGFSEGFEGTLSHIENLNLGLQSQIDELKLKLKGG